MRLLRFFLALLFIALQPTGARATQADAREIARQNNCNPKKIEVVEQSLGGDSRTVYRVECIMPKMKEAAAPQGADALLVQCDGSLCALLRTLAKGEK